MSRPVYWLGYLWASPVTAAGVLQAWLGGARLHSVQSDGVLFFVARPRGWADRFFRRFGVSAYTWGATVTFADERLVEQERLICHERVHVRQTFVLGPLMPLAYGAASAWAWARGKKPYWDNWFEAHARASEDRQRRGPEGR